MRRVFVAAVCLLLMVLAGCGQPAKAPGVLVSAPAVGSSQMGDSTPAPTAPAAPAPVQAAPAPVPSAPSPAPDAALPDRPLWGTPGRVLLGGEPATMAAYPFQVALIDGREIHPVRTPGGIRFLERRDDGVYLVGGLSDRGGYASLATPELLYRNPVRVGDQWKLGGETYRVTALEPQATPSGAKLAARIEVSTTKLNRTEWWVPDHGLVRLERTGQPAWIASQERVEAAEAAPVMGRPAPGVTAIIRDDGRNWSVTSSDGKTLFQVADSYWRSWYSWARTGKTDLLTHTTFPGSYGIYTFDALRWNGQTFEKVPWMIGAESREGVSGDGKWAADGTFTLREFTRYPTRFYTFRFDGKAMVSDPALERLEYAKAAAALVDQMVYPPWISEADMLAVFTDKAKGQQANDLIKRNPSLRALAVKGATDRFELVGTGGKVLAVMQLAKIDGQWKVTDFMIN
ncbi:MAG TPA: hypothetical protein VD973_29600 [Symbiobacteriaceae bacterium]|nr:hypothetical protein [Symbiobacteriaceae bacterium]